MVSCPRCAQQVDETTRTTCPHCFTPLAAVGAPPSGQAPPAQPYPGASAQPSPPQSYAPQLSRSAGTRVSLTGEVIEDNAPAAPPPSYVGGGAPARPPIGMASKPAEANVSRIVSRGVPVSELPKKSGGGTIFAVLIGLVILGGLGAGGWFFLMPHSNPKTTVQQLDTAIAKEDWRTLYSLIDMPASAKSKYPSADAFATSMTSWMSQTRSNPIAAPLVDSFLKGYSTAQVGEPTINGDSATVPVTMTISMSIMGRTSDKTSTQQVPLRKVNGVWKIDGVQGALTGAGAMAAP